ncbi:MAG TPA: NUDIX hydrolase [Pseudolabrys sp.]|nr:NUDIX hydrolase [Pseudolabrys sp.]
MADKSKLADLPGDVTVSAPQRLAKGYRDYERYHVTLAGAGGGMVEQQRDILRAGKVVAILPVDLARDEVILLRQFRMAAHLANGRGDMVEVVAGRAEPGEPVAEAARRECTEEIGVAPDKLVALFSYLTTPGLTDEEVTMYLAAVDTSQVREGEAETVDGEHLHLLRVPIDSAIAALGSGALREGPLLIALQWLALNRDQLPALLGA